MKHNIFLIGFFRILLKVIGIFIIFVQSNIGNFHATVHRDNILSLTKDYRIRNYIYNANEVFLMVVHHGFQSYIEFEQGEIIKTISTGDAFSWSINVLDNRIFIKSLEKYLQTNMTVITNKRIYQFDLISKELDEYKDRDLIYAIKFKYIK